MENPKAALDFLLLAGKLKQNLRLGWTRYNVEDSESIADHLYRSALILMLQRSNLAVDFERCLKMLLLSSLPQVRTFVF